MLQHEPCVTRTFADSAIGNRIVILIHAFLLDVNIVQFLGRLECAVGSDGRTPRDALGPWNMPASLGSFAHAWRRDNFAGEFVRAADIDKVPVALLRVEYLRQHCAQL